MKGDDYVYSIGAQNAQNWGYDNIKSQGWLMGKKSIPGLKNFKPKLFNKNYSKFVDFIIGVDEEGKEIISNSFGKNKGSPNYLTPITFRKDVLTKYYSQPDKYTIGDGYLSCAYLWRLPIDNNHLDYVMVFLGDLGKLSYKEQLHWRSFNVATKGKISYTSWARNFENKFTEPEKSDLFFKQKYRSFQVKWEKKFGWKLFRQLSKEDHHHFKALHVPLTNQQKEFDEQISSLTKILIESLNERELEKRSRIDKKDAKGIDKLEAFLATNNIRCKEMIEFLRDLQKLRSAGAAHLKGRKYERVKQAFSIGEKDLSKVFDDIITKCIWTLNALESYFLRDCRESLTEV